MNKPYLVVTATVINEQGATAVFSEKVIHLQHIPSEPNLMASGIRTVAYEGVNKLFRDLVKLLEPK